MLDALFSAPDEGAQLLSQKFCVDCEAVIPPKIGTGPSSPRCSDCRKAHRRMYEMERYYRRQGMDPIPGAGSIGVCEDCGLEIVKSRADNTVCGDCARDRLNAYNRAKRASDRRAAGTPIRSGITINCEKCGCAFEKKAWNQKYCQICKNFPSIRYAKNRKSSDPVFALNHSMSSSIRKSLNRKKSGYSWESLVGYTVDELITCLERQFLPGMTWANRGDWHIDHIIPVSSFNYDGPDHPDFKACWALTNLRPLWAEDNLRKKDKRLFLI